MADGTTWGQRRLVVIGAVLVSMLLSLFGAASALPDAGAERATRVVAQLGQLAGLEGESPDPRSVLPVRVNQEGGPLWVAPAVEEAVRAHPSFRLAEDGVGIVRVEVVHDEAHVALRGSLYRQGWNLRSEHPVRVRVMPWLPMLALALGLGVAAWSRRIGVGLAVAGALAQLESQVGWPSSFPSVPWSDQVRDGPLGGAVIDLAVSLPDTAVAFGAGIVTLCMVLVAFDHRRSSGKGGAMLAGGMLGVLGVLIWCEAAARCGMGPWIGTAAGAGSILAMALAWGQLGRTLRRA